MRPRKSKRWAALASTKTLALLQPVPSSGPTLVKIVARIAGLIGHSVREAARVTGRAAAALVGAERTARRVRRNRRQNDRWTTVIAAGVHRNRVRVRRDPVRAGSATNAVQKRAANRSRVLGLCRTLHKPAEMTSALNNGLNRDASSAMIVTSEMIVTIAVISVVATGTMRPCSVSAITCRTS